MCFVKGSASLTKSWRSAALAVFPHSGVGHCAALQSHSNISLGKWLNLRIPVKRIYSSLCWGLLQCKHVSQYPQLVVEWVSSERQNTLHSKLWFSGLGGHWCDHQPQELVVALCSRAQLGMAVWSKKLCPCGEENSGTNPNSYQ